MSETEYVCQNCGSGRIYAVIEARGTEDGVVVKGRGGLRFEGDGRPDYDDYNEVDYACAKCDRRAFKLEELVEPRVAAEQNALPCGRCDHLSTDHEARSAVFDPKRFIRPQRPCPRRGMRLPRLLRPCGRVRRPRQGRPARNHRRLTLDAARSAVVANCGRAAALLSASFRLKARGNA